MPHILPIIAIGILLPVAAASLALVVGIGDTVLPGLPTPKPAKPSVGFSPQCNSGSNATDLDATNATGATTWKWHGDGSAITGVRTTPIYM